MPSLKHLPGEAIRCRAIVPVPGKVHTVRCTHPAQQYGLCWGHYTMDRAAQHRVDSRPQALVLYAGILTDRE